MRLTPGLLSKTKVYDEISLGFLYVSNTLLAIIQLIFSHDFHCSLNLLFTFYRNSRVETFITVNTTSAVYSTIVSIKS
jgi:hypothetical protein